MKPPTDETPAFRRTPSEDAALAVRWMKLQGHDVLHTGDCALDCRACGPYRTTPEVEFDTVETLLRWNLDHPPRSRLEMVLSLNRTRLQILARHPSVLARRLEAEQQIKLSSPPVLVELEVRIDHPQRAASAVATVRGLALLPDHELQLFRTQQAALSAPEGGAGGSGSAGASGDPEGAPEGVTYNLAPEPELLDRTCPKCTAAYQGEGSMCPKCLEESRSTDDS